MTGRQLRSKVLFGAALAGAFLLTLQAARAQDNGDYPVHPPDQVIQQTFALGGTPFVKASNINGAVVVVGDATSSVRVEATEKIEARTQDLAAEAKREVRLAMDHTGDSLNVYPDGPFRHDHWENPGYRVTFAITVHVPAGASVEARTVNGTVELENVRGHFEADAVNGTVKANGVTGAGSMKTVNGRIEAVYASEPGGDSSFHTVNGTIDVTFPRGLNAVLRYQTFHGAIYTDFNTTPLAGSTNVAERDDRGMRKFRNGQFTAAQVGHGGPQLSFHTLNGTIYIRRAK